MSVISKNAAKSNKPETGAGQETHAGQTKKDKATCGSACKGKNC